jgi:hypothetical protein
MNADDNVRRQRFGQSAFKKGDHFGQWKWLREAWKVFFLVLCWLPAVSPAAETAPAGWRVWLESRSLRAPVSGAIDGAQHTQWVGGVRDGGWDEWLSKSQWAGLATSWEAFFQQARANADADLAELTPRYVRDRNQVIEYAVLSSDRPVVASAVSSAKFHTLFESTLGEKVLVVVPNRFTAFVFPRLASNYPLYARLVFDAFESTAFKGSLEVFEVGAAGWRAVGIYER